MKDLIYFDKLPIHEKYEFIDTHNDLYGELNLTSRTADNLFIKGINRMNRVENTILLEDFATEYMNLGKKLFELVYEKHRIILKYPYRIAESCDLKDRYVLKNYWELTDGMESEETELIASISNALNKLAYFNTIFYVDTNINIKIINASQEILNNLIILYDLMRLDIYPYLYRLDDIVSSEIKLLDSECASILSKAIFDEKNVNTSEIKEIQTMCFNDLTSMLKELNEMIPPNYLENHLKRSLSRNKSVNLKYIDNINYYGSDMKSFITFLFECNQLKDIEEAIIPFIEKFGFPYYDNKQCYKKNLCPISINDDEDIIPCNILIENSIFYYMYYVLFNDWQTTDKRILEIFDFIPKEKFKQSEELENKTFFKTNRKSIVFYKNNWLRYNDFVCHDILGMKCSYKEVKDVINSNDNHFNIIGKKGFNYKIIFYNLCTAMNMLLQEKTDYFTADTTTDNCKFCGKKFTPTSKLKKYCSESCRDKRRKLLDNNRKKKHNINI